MPEPGKVDKDADEFIGPGGVQYHLPKSDEKGDPPKLEWEPSTEMSDAPVRVVRQNGVLLLEVVGR